jgi:hypothetical protein
MSTSSLILSTRHDFTVTSGNNLQNRSSKLVDLLIASRLKQQTGFDVVATATTIVSRTNRDRRILVLVSSA